MAKGLVKSYMKPEWHGYLIQYKVQQYRIVKTFELFRKYNIEPILIKGWAAARNYLQKEERLFLDIDICVAPSKFKEATKILVDSYKEGLTIDLHNGLRHLDTVEWDDLFENSELVKLEATDIRVLRPEDHLRILCVHWLNDGASNKQRLWDIYYAVENRPPDFDWERCLDIVGEKRKKWIVCAIGIAHKYIELRIDDLPIAEQAANLPQWLIDALEKEWSQETQLIPLVDCLINRKAFFTQLRKRFPPNPIQATIEVGGEFDNGTRFYYQIEDVFLRLKRAFVRDGKNLLRQTFYK